MGSGSAPAGCDMAGVSPAISKPCQNNILVRHTKVLYGLVHEENIHIWDSEWDIAASLWPSNREKDDEPMDFGIFRVSYFHSCEAIGLWILE